MFDKTKELHDLSELYCRYAQCIRMYHDLKIDVNRIWCVENEKIENARKEAESAIYGYLDLISDVYYDRENELSDLIHKRK